MERDFKIIKLPISGTEVKFKAWLTGFEKREIQNSFIDMAKISGVTGVSPQISLTAEMINQAQDKTFQQIIVEVSGKADWQLSEILELHSADFDFLVIEINKVTSGEAWNELKKN